MHFESESTWSWCGDLTARDRRNQWSYILWMLTWMLSFVAGMFLLEFDWVSGAFGYVVALVPSLLGVGAVMAFLRFVRQADELQRKIQVEALGWGFGAGAIFMFGYQLLEGAGLPAIDIADPAAVMFVSWALATVVLARRYA